MAQEEERQVRMAPTSGDTTLSPLLTLVLHHIPGTQAQKSKVKSLDGWHLLFLPSPRLQPPHANVLQKAWAGGTLWSN